MKIKTKLERTWKLVSGSVTVWNNQNALEWGAALAYYTAFSIAPLLIIALGIVGLFYKGDSLSYIHAQIANLVGENVIPGSNVVWHLLDSGLSFGIVVL